MENNDGTNPGANDPGNVGKPGGKFNWSLTLKIAVPLLIVATVVGVWGIKNLPHKGDDSPGGEISGLSSSDSGSEQPESSGSSMKDGKKISSLSDSASASEESQTSSETSSASSSSSSSSSQPEAPLSQPDAAAPAPQQDDPAPTPQQDDPAPTPPPEEQPTEPEPMQPTGTLELTSFDLNSLLSQGKPVLLVVGATWCGYCQRMQPDLEAAYSEYAGRVIIRHIDADLYPIGSFPVLGYPSLFLWEADGSAYQPGPSMPLAGYLDYPTYNGAPLTRLTGYVDGTELGYLLEDLLA